MKTLYLATAVLSLGLAACDRSENEAATANETTVITEGAEGTADTGDGTTTTTWPEGSRIVVEEGVTYRIDPTGTRVALGPNESRVVVEEGVRYRVDPSGTRVRIDEEGFAVDVDADGVAATVNTTD